MVRKAVFAAVASMALLAGSGSAMADGYRPDEYLGLDLSKAVLSPKPLGPPAQFESVPVEAKTESHPEPAHARAARGHVPVVKAARIAPKPAQVAKIARIAPKAAPELRVAHARMEKQRRAGSTMLVRRHTNLLDAQAMDARVQVWPCRSGGICNWQRPAQGE
ncbi:hypothetical protein [uncultured Bradyrhizobium sp.]|uniref:hypothetical protein n=1 Tax=uncultured Bradyrhizobium sp. TaxID=199684 RepID=UPI0035CB2FDC